MDKTAAYAAKKAAGPSNIADIRFRYVLASIMHLNIASELANEYFALAVLWWDVWSNALRGPRISNQPSMCPANVKRRRGNFIVFTDDVTDPLQPANIFPGSKTSGTLPGKWWLFGRCYI